MEERKGGRVELKSENRKGEIFKSGKLVVRARQNQGASEFGALPNSEMIT